MAIAPQIPPNANSQTVIEMNEPVGGIRNVSSPSQGISAPIEKARRSPRSKIAQMTSGVGTTHQTSDARIARPSDMLSHSKTATAVIKTKIRARLNWNRGVENRCGG